MAGDKKTKDASPKKFSKPGVNWMSYRGEAILPATMGEASAAGCELADSAHTNHIEERRHPSGLQLRIRKDCPSCGPNIVAATTMAVTSSSVPSRLSREPIEMFAKKQKARLFEPQVVPKTETETDTDSEPNTDAEKETSVEKEMSITEMRATTNITAREERPSKKEAYTNTWTPAKKGSSRSAPERPSHFEWDRRWPQGRCMCGWWKCRKTQHRARAVARNRERLANFGERCF